MFFDWFRKKKRPTSKATIKLDHTGGSIDIVITGNSDKHVAYVFNRIKASFNLEKPKNNRYTQEELDSIWKEFDKVFRQADDVFDKM